MRMPTINYSALLLVTLSWVGANTVDATSRGWLIIANSKEEAQVLTQAAVERAQASDQTMQDWFEDYKAFYGKVYQTTEEQTNAFRNFNLNMKNVLDINSNPSLAYWTTGNIFSDMSQEELEASLLTVQPPTDYSSVQTAELSADAAVYEEVVLGRKLLAVGLSAARQVDWRLSGKVSSVKYQGKCGACWAFSAVGAIESAYLIHHDLTSSDLNLDLSEQELIECVDEATGCAGGGANQAFNYAAEKTGLTTEAKYPFTLAKAGARQGTCSNEVNGPVVQLAEGVQWGPSKNEQLLMSLVAQQPVVAYFKADSAFLSFAGGVYQSSTCGTKVNHALLIVGYLWTGSTSGSSWIVKNSWGPFWGEAGFARIAMTGTGTSGTCGLYLYTMYPPLKFAQSLDKK